MRLLWKYITNYFLVYQLISHFLLYLQNYKEFEAEILDLQLEKYGLSFDIKKYTTSGWALGDENVIGIRAFKIWCIKLLQDTAHTLYRHLYLEIRSIELCSIDFTNNLISYLKIWGHWTNCCCCCFSFYLFLFLSIFSFLFLSTHTLKSEAYSSVPLTPWTLWYPSGTAVISLWYLLTSWQRPSATSLMVIRSYLEIWGI